MHTLIFQQVSWVRHRGIHLLTVGRYTYTSDQRFQAIHSPQTEDWTLQIRYPQIRDSGYYECQVGATPPIGHTMILTVVGEYWTNLLNYNFFLEFNTIKYVLLAVTNINLSYKSLSFVNYKCLVKITDHDYSFDRNRY